MRAKHKHAAFCIFRCPPFKFESKVYNFPFQSGSSGQFTLGHHRRLTPIDSVR